MTRHDRPARATALALGAMLLGAMSACETTKGTADGASGTGEGVVEGTGTAAEGAADGSGEIIRGTIEVTEEGAEDVNRDLRRRERGGGGG